MSVFANISIRGKMISAFALVLFCTAGLGGFAITRVSILNADASALAVAEIISSTAAQTAGILAEQAVVLQNYHTNSAIYAPTMDPGAETADGNGFNKAWGQITNTISQINTAEQGGDPTTATTLTFIDLASGIAAFQKHIDADYVYQNSAAIDHAGTANAGARLADILICAEAGGGKVPYSGPRAGWQVHAGAGEGGEGGDGGRGDGG